MARLPRPRARELIAALARVGFVVARIRGGHHVLKHADGRMTVVPLHAGELIGPGLLMKILRDCEMTADELRALL